MPLVESFSPDSSNNQMKTNASEVTTRQEIQVGNEKGNYRKLDLAKSPAHKQITRSGRFVISRSPSRFSISVIQKSNSHDKLNFECQSSDDSNGNTTVESCEQVKSCQEPNRKCCHRHHFSIRRISHALSEGKEINLTLCPLCMNIDSPKNQTDENPSFQEIAAPPDNNCIKEMVFCDDLIDF